MISLPLISLCVALYGLGCLIWLCVPIKEDKAFRKAREIPTRYISSKECVTEEME